MAGASTPSIASNAIGPHQLGTRRCLRQCTVGKPPDVGGLERMWHQLATGRPAVEQQHVHAESAESHPLAVDHTQQPQRLAVDAGLLADLFHRHLGGRVADVGPTGGIQPDAGVLALHQQDLARIVADDRSDGDFRRHVPGHPLADRLQPLLHEVIGLALHGDRLAFDFTRQIGFDRRRFDVGGDVEHLFVALALVQVLGEPHTGAGDRSQRLAPSRQFARARRHGAHVRPSAIRQQRGAALVGSPCGALHR